MVTSIERHHRLHEHPVQASFWRAAFDRLPGPTQLPRDLLAGVCPAECARLEAAIETQLAGSISRITRDDPALLSAFCLTMAAVVLARAVGEQAVTVMQPGPAPLVLSVEVAPHKSFRLLLREVREGYLRAAGNLDVPVDLLFAQTGLAPSDLAVAPGYGGADPFGCPLRLDVDLPAEIAALHYRADLFTEQTAQRLLSCFLAVAREATADPDRPIGPWLAADSAELAAIEGFNATDLATGEDVALHRFLERAASRWPRRVAIADDATTFAELNARANRLAHRLIAAGVQAGDVVGVHLTRSPTLITAVYAILKAGAAYLPLDPGLPANRLAYMLSDSGARLVLGTGDPPPELAATYLRLDDAQPPATPDEDPQVAVGGDDLCYVIYTSGSTGRPKGVMVEHRAIINRLQWMQRAYPLHAGDVILHKTPFTFDVSVWELFWWSIAGAGVATLPAGQERDPDLIAEHVAAYRVTTMHFVPSMLQAFLWYFDGERDDRLTSLRRVFTSGEALPAAQAPAFAATVGCSLVNLYGPTEAAVDVTHFDCAALGFGRPVPIGRPIDNTRLHIITRHGTPAPIGTPGELLLAGIGLARGYCRAPSLTAERFVPDPARPGQRRYRTGDRARWLPDGTVEFLGRLDSQVKIRGYRIELGEIEQVCLSTPGVRDCAVTVVDESGDLLCAYVVCGEGYSEQKLRARLGEEIPSYMLPHFVVPVAALPTSRHGKRDLSGLPRPQRSPTAPKPQSYKADPTHDALARIWREQLGVADVGPDDNFFALGGDSIKVIAVLAAARNAGLRFTFQDLYAHPTIRGLAEVARPGEPQAQARSVPFAEVNPADRVRLPADAVDAYPLSTLQAGLTFEVGRAGDAGLYHDVANYRVRGELDEAALRGAVELVARRRAVFRTSLHPNGFSEPLQVVHGDAPAPLRIIDLSALAEPEQQHRLAEFTAAELGNGFAPGATGLVRVAAHRLSGDEWQYTLSYAAAVLDGWSVSLVNRDLFAAYLALRQGRTPPQQPPEARYGDYVRLERNAISDPAQRAYWASVLDGAENTRIPALTPATATPGDPVLVQEVPLPEGISQRLRAVAEGLGVPVKSVLLAAHLAVVGFAAGTADVTTGYEHSGRPETEGGADIAGLFLNTVPVRMRLAAQSWAGLIRAAYQCELELLPHRRYPMAEARRRAKVSGLLFDTVFNFTHFYALEGLRREHGLTVVRESIRSHTEFPLRAEFWQDPFTDEIGLALHCHRDTYPPVQAQRLGGYYARALELLAADPQAGHRAQSLLGQQELEQLARLARGPATPAPTATAVDLFAEQVRRRPDAVAVTCRDAQLSYRDLDGRSRELASRMGRAGIGHGDVVAVLLDRDIAWAVSVLAILRLGAVYLPFDPGDPPARQATMMRRAGCTFLLTDDRPADGFDPQITLLRLAGGTGAADGPLVAVAGDGTADRQPEASPSAGGDAVRQGGGPLPGDVAYVLFTSGSTGEPKGARITHAGLLNHAHAKIDDLELGETDRIAQTATAAFDISVWQLLVAWLVGARTVIVPAETISHLARFTSALARAEVTVLELVPAYADALLGMPAADLPALRLVLITGEALPPALTRRWFERYRVPLVNAYGPTECSDDVAHHTITGPAGGDRVPIGRPIRNTGLYVVGPDDRPLPIGSYGEICVTGAGVGLGYVNDPGRTAAAFRPNGFDSLSSTCYRTGDVGRWLADGVLDCAGRVDSQIKIRGHRIELSEVEAHLGRVPGVTHAVAVLGRAGLAAFFTGPADAASIRERLVSSVPRYLVPEEITRLESFPRTSNGKIDRAALAKLGKASTAREITPPADPLEERLRGTFAEVLGRDAAEIGVTDNFFDLGGHSLSAMQLVSRLAAPIGVADLLAGPTVRGLAARLRAPAAHAALFVDLTELAGREPDSPYTTLVCVPYAGGHAASYLPLARACGGAIRVLAAASADVQALAGALPGPVIVLGHSAGAALAFSLSLALQAAGRPPRRLIVVAAAGPALHPGAGDGEILRWLAQAAGDDIATLEPQRLLSDFRHDIAVANGLYEQVLAFPDRCRLHSPVTLVLAADDPVAGDAAYVVNSWRRFADDLTLVTAESGGHYLNASRPQFLADIVASAVEWRRS